MAAAAISHTRLQATSIRVVIEEVLGTVITKVHRDRLLAEALALGGVDTVPAGGPALESFLDGPLRMVLLSALATRVTDSLIDDMRRAAEQAGAFDDADDDIEDSAVRYTDPRARELFVAVVTEDTDAFTQVSRLLPPTAIIVRHHHVASLAHGDAGDGRAVAEPLICVVDVRRGALPAAAELWPAIEGRELVLWGADSWSDARVAIALGPARSWLRCPSSAGPSEIVAMCRALALAASVQTG